MSYLYVNMNYIKVTYSSDVSIEIAKVKIVESCVVVLLSIWLF